MNYTRDCKTHDFHTHVFRHSYQEQETIYGFQYKNLTKNKNKINFVVTHGNCLDGFMSSTIARRYLISSGVNTQSVTFFNACHGSDFSMLPDMMRDKFVIICDFSFSKLLFDKMIEATKGNILILDHHITAQKCLHDVPTEYLTFDLKHSGAFITWTYFFGFDNVPKAVLYVEDNDIWTKSLPWTREFTAYMTTCKYEYDEYEKFFDDSFLLERVFPIGIGMRMRDDANMELLRKDLIPNFVKINRRYYFISCLNTSILKSEMGNFALSHHINANLSMMYSHNHYSGSTSISYRSMDNRSDSSEIAKISGGGGHRNASGALIHYLVNTPPGRVIDSHIAYSMLDKIYETTIKGRLFLALNTPSIKKPIVSYLMQERFFNDEGKIMNNSRVILGLPGYQEGMYCMRNLHAPHDSRYVSPDNNIAYFGAYAWNYDGNINNIIVKTLPKIFDFNKLAQVGLNNSIQIVDLKNDCYDITVPAIINIEQLFFSLM